MFLKSFVSIAAMMLAAHMLFALIQAAVVGGTRVPLTTLVRVGLMALVFAWNEQRLLKAKQEEENQND